MMKSFIRNGVRPSLLPFISNYFENGNESDDEAEEENLLSNNRKKSNKSKRKKILTPIRRSKRQMNVKTDFENRKNSSTKNIILI